MHNWFLKVQVIDQGKNLQVDLVRSVTGFSNCMVIYCLQLTRTSCDETIQLMLMSTQGVL